MKINDLVVAIGEKSSYITYIEIKLVEDQMSLQSKLEELMLELIEENPDTAAEEFGGELAAAFVDYFRGMEGEPEDKQKWYEEARDSFIGNLENLDPDFDCEE